MINTLNDLLKYISEEDILINLIDTIEEYFDAEDFFRNYFSTNDKKENTKKLENLNTIKKEIIKTISNDFSLYCKSFFNKLSLSEKINNENSLLKEIFTTYSNELFSKFMFKRKNPFPLADILTGKVTALAEDYPNLFEQKVKVKDYQYYKDEFKEIPFSILKDSDEPIGSTCFINYLDYTNREYPFVIINNSIFLKGNSGDTHTELLQSYLENLSDEKIENYDYINRETGIDLINKELSPESLCFGHCMMDMAFVDSFDNCSIDDVLDLIMNQKNIKKVYTVKGRIEPWEATRVAKKVIKNE